MQWAAVSQHVAGMQTVLQLDCQRRRNHGQTAWRPTRATRLQLLLPDLNAQHSPDVHHGPGAEADGPRQAGHLWGRARLECCGRGGSQGRAAGGQGAC